MSDIRVFAISGDIASELPRFRAKKPRAARLTCACHVCRSSCPVAVTGRPRTARPRRARRPRVSSSSPGCISRVLWSFAVAQPLFGILADSPEFFVARGNTRGDILLFAIGVTLVPPTLLLAIEAAFARMPRVRSGLHLVFVAVLAAAVAVQLFDDAVGAATAVLLAAAALAGVALAVAYARTRPVPELLTILSPAPVVFLVIFLLISPVSKLVLPQDAGGLSRGAGALEHPGGAGRAGRVRHQHAHELPAADRSDPLPELRGACPHRHVVPQREHRGGGHHRRGAGSRSPRLARARTRSRSPPTIPDNLFTLLGQSHAMRVLEPTTELCPERLCGGRREMGSLRASAR